MHFFDILGNNEICSGKCDDPDLLGSSEFFAVMSREEFSHCGNCMAKDNTVLYQEEEDLHSCLEVHANYYSGLLNSISIEGDQPVSKFFQVYISKQALVLVSDLPDPFIEGFLAKLDSARIIKRFDDISPRALLFELFAQIVAQDNAIVDAIEDELDELENHILEDADRYTARAILVKRKLVNRLRHELEPIDDVLVALLENENKLFSPREVAVLKTLRMKSQKLVSNTTLLRDYATQIREAYQAQRDLKNNDIMRVFTIVTSIFLPLTLLVGWYGMNFAAMPELHSKLGYPGVVIASIAIVGGMLAYFKRKKWL